MKKNMYRNLRKSVAWFTAAVTALKTPATKTFLLLLITTTGFSMMSFTNDDTSIHKTAQHLTTGKQDKRHAEVTATADTCCIIEMPKADNKAVRAGIIIAQSIPGNTVTILEEAKTIQIGNTKLWISLVKADEELYFNFQISQMYPSAEVSASTDMVMIEKFTEAMVAGLHRVDASVATAADAEVTDHFMEAHFSARLNYLDMLIKADVEMMQAFETANPISIAMPSKMIFINADAEMTRAFEQDIQ